MDASHLGLDTGTFAGVVDKGTIDAVLSGGLEPAKRICTEVMRVLEPGGKFLVVSNLPGDRLLADLLRMCGPGSCCDPPLFVSGKGVDDPCVYAYIVRKTLSASAEATTLSDDSGNPVLSTRALPKPGRGLSPAKEQHGAQPQDQNNSSADTAVATAISEVRYEVLNEGEEDGDAPRDIPMPCSVAHPETSSPVHALPRCTHLHPKDVVPDARKPDSSPKESSTNAMKANHPISKIREDILDMSRVLKESQDGIFESKVTTAEHFVGSKSLPWGAQESLEIEGVDANYELDLGKKIRKLDLSVKIAATHLKVSLRPAPGAEFESVVDRELHEKVNVGESTWSIQDKTVVSVK